MSAQNGQRIAIVGAGFSGSLLAVQLLRRMLPSARVYLVEKNAQFGLGLAYATGNPGHVLNVRAGRMSAFADEPDHFIDWLRSAPPAANALADTVTIGADTFVSRRVYGAYIQDLLSSEIWQAENGRNLYLVPDEAIALRRRDAGFALEMRGGRSYDVDVAVLAVGNAQGEDEAAHYYANPWSAHALEGLRRDAPVLLIGTGLTMVDTVISLLDRGHRGPIHALSRRGLLPRRHATAPAVGGLDPALLHQPDLASLLRGLRAQARSGAGEEQTWRSVVDAFRPFTQSVWQRLGEEQQRRFLRHLRPWWDVHRHRMAPAVADVIDQAIASGQLIVGAARILAREADAEGITVRLRRRGADDVESLRVDRVIDCSATQTDYADAESPLVHGLLESGMASLDRLGLGLAVTTDCEIIDREGRLTSGLYALGPATRGTFWEITSVPDIREQCWQLASRLAVQAHKQD